MAEIEIDEEERPSLEETYGHVPYVIRDGRPLPADVCPICEFVAASVGFPHRDAQVHRYDKIYPSDVVADRETGHLQARGETYVIRNDHALAKEAAARLVIIAPKCGIRQHTDDTYFEMSAGYAHVRGAHACEECFPE